MGRLLCPPVFGKVKGGLRTGSLCRQEAKGKQKNLAMQGPHKEFTLQLTVTLTIALYNWNQVMSKMQMSSKLIIQVCNSSGKREPRPGIPNREIAARCLSVFCVLLRSHILPSTAAHGIHSALLGPVPAVRAALLPC